MLLTPAPAPSSPPARECTQNENPHGGGVDPGLNPGRRRGFLNRARQPPPSPAEFILGPAFGRTRGPVLPRRAKARNQIRAIRRGAGEESPHLSVGCIKRSAMHRFRRRCGALRPAALMHPTCFIPRVHEAKRKAPSQSLNCALRP